MILKYICGCTTKSEVECIMIVQRICIQAYSFYKYLLKKPEGGGGPFCENKGFPYLSPGYVTNCEFPVNTSMIIARNPIIIFFQILCTTFYRIIRHLERIFSMVALSLWLITLVIKLGNCCLN